MEYIDNILFAILLLAGIVLFAKNVRKIRRNILIGRDTDRTDNKSQRWKIMTRVALGQSKMMTRPIPAILHIFVYVGFIIINIEVLEILIDGVAGTHRVLSFLGPLYTFLIATFEVLAVLVMLGCAIFLIRRNILKLKRFISKDLDGWPRSDANYILFSEILLMSAFLTMNAIDQNLQGVNEHYKTISSSAFPVSQYLRDIFSGISPDGQAFTERFLWWFHILGILAFMNYLPYSKHLHILLAFPNTWF